MVEIRKLQPTVHIALPARLSQPVRRSYVHVERRRVNFPPPTPQATPCVLWQGSVDRDGYGRMKRGPEGKRETVRVIRWVMSEVKKRPLRADEHVLHACDNPPCYRVDHLSLGSIQDNNADMLAKGRNVKPPINRYTGECHPMAKLNERQVRAIRGHYISGLSQKTIAEMFDVSPTTIGKIVRGVLWASGSSQQVFPPRSTLSAAGGEGPSAPLRVERTKPVKLRIPTKPKDQEDDL